MSETTLEFEVPPAATASLNPFRTLHRHRNFRLFWFGQTLSLIGTWMQSMAEGWLALELSNSAFVVGLVAAAQSLPILALSLPAGVFVDRHDKLRIVRIAQTLLSVQASTLFWLTWTHRLNIGWLLAMATANGTISAFEIPARQSLVIELVGREDLPGAIALNSSGFNLARVIGPSIGAIVIAKLGIAWCFGVNAASYITVLVGLFLIQLPAWVPPEHLSSPLEGIRQGVVYMRDTPSIAALMRFVTIYSILGVPYLTLMPVVARNRLALGADGYGALLACVGVGGVLGALMLAAAGDRFRRTTVLNVASYTFSTLLIAFSLVRRPAYAYPILLGVGFTMIVNNASANSMLQHLAPNELRGRLMAAYSFVVVGLSSVIGSLVAGSIAHVIGVSWAIGGGAAIMLGYTYWAFERRPELRSLE
ncbi:MAG TPA: MFS transporter [Gemmatimonadaceae bacterium]|nr:MFS transporter [Gemmatimonadaceae bacterium]